ncbi:hypothetical protein C6P40_002209 [Pichia californica]|uniref:FAD-binding FR-type domain-containing protein n=1 Tax=Pichia californica TaxID=460514 RepID=A0A9P7BEX7_9ASCO|nr:hypothetical protein C6P42_000781 [[Candida] californica]KAG0687530.1 hypothetical protein C6P40_002209 [[Candida] californica]
MQLINLLQVLLIVTSVVNADKWVSYKHSYYAASGCKVGVDKYANFCGKPETAKVYKCICSNKYAIASWVYCSLSLDPNDEKNIADDIANICHTNYPTSNLTSSQVTNYYNTYKDSAINIDNNTSFNTTNAKSAIYSEKMVKYSHLTYLANQHRWGNVSTSHYLGISFATMVGLVAIFSGIINWSLRLSRNLSHKFNGKTFSFIRKNFNLGIIGTHLHVNKFQGINPDRVEAFLIFLMFLYSILCCTIIGHHWTKGDTIFTTYQAGTSRYYGDRACIMASYQFPFLFIFAGRNNFFQWVTRWKYSRFVTFHKWLGRILFMEILIHGCAMASQTYALKKFTRFGTSWYREGITAAVCFAFILLLSAAPIRRYWYEFFFVSHMVLVICFLSVAWRHAYSQDYQNFYWSCAAIWIFDTLIRACRIISNGGLKTAEIELFPGEDVLKVTVSESKFFKGKPGNHSFIHFLTPTRFWQSHPFTVYPSETTPGYVTYVCRVKKGMTKYISDKCQASPDLKITMKICIDGYYGEQSEYQNYDKSVFITGGTGIAGPYFHAKKLAESNNNREIKLYWSVRTYECIKWFVPELSTFRGTQIKPVIYISKPELNNRSSSGDDENEKKSSEDDSLSDEKSNILKTLDFVEIKHGRLNVDEIIASEITNASGSIAFGACAHTEVVDSVRKNVASSLNLSQHKIEYFEEMQCW